MLRKKKDSNMEWQYLGMCPVPDEEEQRKSLSPALCRMLGLSNPSAVDKCSSWIIRGEGEDADCDSRSPVPSPQCVEGPHPNGILRGYENDMIDQVVRAIELVEEAKTDEEEKTAKIKARELVGDFLVNFLAEKESDDRKDIVSAPKGLFHILLFIAEVDRQDWELGGDLNLEEEVDLFLNEVRNHFPLETCPVYLIPVLYGNTKAVELPVVYSTRPRSPVNEDVMTMEGDGGTPSAVASQNYDSGAVEFVLNHGIGICATVEEMRTAFMTVGTQKLTPPAVARIMNGLWKAYDHRENEGLNNDHNSSWSLKPFVQAATELSPGLVWTDVVRELDFQGLYVRDGKGFRAFMEALKYSMQLQGIPRADQFPIELFYRRWINTGVDAQIFFFKALLNPNNFDVFYLLDYPHHPVSIEMLKTSGDKSYDVKEIAIWKSIELIDILLSLSDAGNYPAIQEMFQFPIMHCPDLLLLGLTQVSSSVNVLRQELMGALLPIFLGNHINSGVLLQYIWHNGSSSLRPIMIHSMAEWYLRGEYDQTKLSRILDIAQDLKALHLLLNASSHVFIIDLACLASRREFLKLGKWLSDKIREHGESFVSSIVKVIKRRVPFIMGKEDNIPKTAQLPPETLTVLFQCLRQCVGKVNQELSDTIVSMSTAYDALLNMSRPSSGPPPPPGVLRQHRDSAFTSTGFQGGEGMGSMGTAFGGLSLNGGSSAGTFGGFMGGQQQPTPGSPSRLLGPGFNSAATSANNYPMLSGLQMGPNTAAPNVAAATAALMGSMNNNTMGMLGGRLAASQGGNNQTSQNAIGSSGGGTGTGPVTDKRGGLPEAGLLFNEIQGEISKEAEDEANNYFHRIYSKPPDPTMTIDEVLDLLKRFQESNVRKEREVFTCMLRNLFEEYKFFPQYPDKELHTTAQLFGGIIEHGLVTTYLQLGVALRFVVDALKKPPGSKIYFFGLAAVERFKNRLKEYPQYCQHLSSIPHFSEFPAHLIDYIEYGTRSQEPPRGGRTGAQQHAPGTNAAGVGSKGMSTVVGSSSKGGPQPVGPPGPSIIIKPSIANACNITTLLAASETEKDENNKIVVPPETVQDKTSFIFNNLNQMNLAQKCEELRDMMGVEHWAWVAQYLVMKRASIELNFHSLYSNLLDTLKVKELYVCVLRETHRNIRILLRADKSAGNFSDRALLKNLGHWLGMITLLRNKPIILDDLDVKSLIIEAYRKGIHDLLYVVPFAAKIMESCARSKIFCPHCPWTMGILNVLGELHQEPDMKLNLKFEIEVLCKALNIEMKELKPTAVLKDESAFKVDFLQLNYSKGEKPRAPTSSGDKIKGLESLMPSSSSISIPTPQPQPQPQPQSAPATVLEEPSSSSISTTPPQHHASASLPALSSTPTPLNAPDPKFSYMDIDTSNLSALLANVTINGQLPLFQANPQLKQFVRPSIEKGIQDLLAPVVERSVKYTINATEQIIKKDFALDYEEGRMRAAAHHMMRYLTAGMAMITSRDHIFIAITNNLKTAFAAQLRAAAESQQMKDMIDQACSVIANDNMEIACVFIQKSAVEKGLVEIDKKLASDYEIRKQAKAENRRYCDPQMMTFQVERIPEQIRMKPAQPSGPVSQQLAVYEDFSRSIPGFIPPSEGEVGYVVPRLSAASGTVGQQSGVGSLQPLLGSGAQNPPGSGEDLMSIYEKIALEMESYLQGLALSHSPASQQLAQGVKNLMEAICVVRNSQSVVAAITLLQKAVEGLLEGLAAFPSDPEIIRYRDAHLMVLKGLQDERGFGQQWVNRQVTKCLIESRPEVKYNTDAVDTLIRAGLVNMIQFDAHLSNAMDKGTNVLAVNFAMQLVQMYLVDERYNTVVSESDLYHTVDMLSRVATVNRQHPEGLIHLIEVLRNHEAPSFAGDRAQVALTATPNLQMGITPAAREFDESQGLVEKAEMLFREWIRLYITQGSPRDSNKAFQSFIHDLNQSGILKSDDIITRFFRVCIQFCVSQVYQGLQAAKTATPAQPIVRTKAYQSVDALVRLVALLIRHIGDTSTTQPKVNLLNKFLGIVAGLLIQDHDIQKQEFQQLPFHRLFIMLFQDLNSTDPVFEAIGMQILAGFSNILHILSPLKVSGFVYAWLEIIGNRTFIQRMLALAADQKCWAMYCQLLLDLFKFLQPYLRNADLAKPVATLYRGTLRVLLVILHDFPDFLCEYCYHFLDAIPPNCIQMRNLVLSAFPRNMRLPDPFTANLKFEMLADTAMPPRINLNINGMIQPAKFKSDLESYLRTRSPVTFLSELRDNLQVANEHGTRYNIPLLNALVLFVGSQHISAIRSRGQTPGMSTIASTSHMDIFQNLAVDLDTEGRYLFLNALANQLRFPSSHTHYFSLVILYLFAHSNTEVVQEQITRVLLERLVVNRPHPWGLLVTFIELIKNPAYKFWSHEFVHCAPEVEKLFESVARSCMVTKNTPVPAGSGPTLNLSTSAPPPPNGPGVMNLDGTNDILALE